MSDTTCLARLLSSAVHDLRNVLAVVRESSGLTADLLRLQEDVPKRDRMLSALSEVQAQVARGALLASAMDLLAECGAAGKAGSGDAGKEPSAWPGPLSCVLNMWQRTMWTVQRAFPLSLRPCSGCLIQQPKLVAG